jgi:uncharacterized phage protein (TIGR01671 family)
MRQIKFRGKSIETGEWIYGNLIGTDVIVGDIVEWDSEYFCTEFWYKVDPETVGQLTSLQDRNGKDIYEGDIVSNGQHIDWVVNYKNASFSVYHVDSITSDTWCLNKGMAESREIIGNIHSNPELLEATV